MCLGAKFQLYIYIHSAAPLSISFFTSTNLPKQEMSSAPRFKDIKAGPAPCSVSMHIFFPVVYKVTYRKLPVVESCNSLEKNLCFKEQAPSYWISNNISHNAIILCLLVITWSWGNQSQIFNIEYIRILWNYRLHRTILVCITKPLTRNKQFLKIMICPPFHTNTHKNKMQ